MAAHVKHKRAIKPEMFERWLGLWRETAAQVLDDENTIAITAKAERIAESLQLGMFFEPKSRGGAARKEVSRGCSNS